MQTIGLEYSNRFRGQIAADSLQSSKGIKSLVEGIILIIGGMIADGS